MCSKISQIVPPTIEEDKPPEDVKSSEQKLSEDTVKRYEKGVKVLKDLQDINIKEKSYKLAYKLVFSCIVVILILYVIDTILINYGLKNSQLLNSIFELFKFLISSLFGFVFAQKLKSE